MSKFKFEIDEKVTYSPADKEWAQDAIVLSRGPSGLAGWEGRLAPRNLYEIESGSEYFVVGEEDLHKYTNEGDNNE